MEITAYQIAERYIGMKELPGDDKNNPFIMSFLRLDHSWPGSDEVPWCSGFVNHTCWLLRLPRSKSLMARSWLKIGYAIDIEEAEPGFDIVIFSRGKAPKGHVGFFAGKAGGKVYCLGGNQSDSVNVKGYGRSRLLGVRRLVFEPWMTLTA